MPSENDRNPIFARRISLEKFEEFLKKWGAILKKEWEEELEHLKSIVTPEEFQEFLKERKRMSKLKLRLVGEYDKEEIEKLENKAKEEVNEFLRKYADKRFLISKKFFSYAVETLYQSLRWSRELPLIGIFKEKDDRMVMDSFIKPEWLLNNEYARSSFGMSFRLK